MHISLKIEGLTCTLGSGLPLGKEGPFVHVASIVATLLSKLIASFQGIYDNESRTGEMLAAACAVGVAATFYAPIGGVLFSIEVTTVYFAVRNYWRGFFAACCSATFWRLYGVWFKKEVFKIGAAFGRLSGELMALAFPEGIPFGGYRTPIVPGGYSVVGAAAFTGAVTHTISTSVIVFELTGQMTHMIPVIIAVLIANAVCQTMDLSIYDSIIQIKRLPFLPPILNTSSLAHNIFVEDIMVRDVIYIWRKCTYRDIQKVLKNKKKLTQFPLVDNGANMILLGSIQSEALERIANHQLSRERRLQEVRRRFSINDTIQMPPRSLQIKTDPVVPNSSPHTMRRMSRFEVTPVVQFDIDKISPISSQSQTLNVPKAPKSILKQTVPYTYSPNNTIACMQDSRIRLVFENIFLKSLKLQDANPDKEKSSEQIDKKEHSNRRVQLPRERVIDMSPEEQLVWEEEQLNMVVDFNQCDIDPSPFQLVERTTLYKVHSLFSMLGLEQAYVTSIGRLVGVVALKDVGDVITKPKYLMYFQQLREGIEKMNAGLLIPQSSNDQNRSVDGDNDDEETGDDQINYQVQTSK
ncbi:chloride channel protein-like protein [Sarcoptes scabiei]|uniref:Chloride channel protein-like protein n=1 Tax=Sarcoptes scabiei TaxID=52283 RepID=A0A132AFZ9_SARSC|nr:chloride channel protein-like protein [Sarcoptes scabiei]